MSKLKDSRRIKILLAVVLLSAAFLALRFFHVDFSDFTVASFKEKIDSFGIWGPVVYILLYVLRPLVLFPASVFSAAAGAAWGINGLAYMLIGANLSSSVEFLIARYYARQPVQRLVQGKLDGISQGIEKNGFVTVLLIRLIPNVPWDIQNLALGLTKVRFRDYALATFVGILPGSLALVYFGSSFIRVLMDPKHFWEILVAFVILGGLYFLQCILTKKQISGPAKPTD